MNPAKLVLEIEVCLNPDDPNPINLDSLKQKIESYLKRYFSTLPLNHLLEKCDLKSDICLMEKVEFLQICSCPNAPLHITDAGFISLDQKVEMVFYFYTCVDGDSEEEERAVGKDGEPRLCDMTILPCEKFQGLWENLVFEEDIKTKLLTYVNTALLFGDKGVNANIISINRVALLLGPPGTGKTTLAKALAQKMTIRMGEKRYPNGGILVEINPNAIFSKYFAESSKLLLKMFNQLHSMLDDEDSFVCLLMDEVESLTAARKAAMNGNEPSDAIRVVNCLLTQIDKLKARGNVLVLATSNITEAIDIAFLDRADIKQFIGDPTTSAVYTILCQAVTELMRTGLIQPSLPLHTWRTISRFCPALSDNHVDAASAFDLSTDDSMDTSIISTATVLINPKEEIDQPSSFAGQPQKDDEQHMPESIKMSLQLSRLAALAQGLSGRTLTKLSFLAYSYTIQTSNDCITQSCDSDSAFIPLSIFYEGLQHVIMMAHECNRKKE